MCSLVLNLGSLSNHMPSINTAEKRKYGLYNVFTRFRKNGTMVSYFAPENNNPETKKKNGIR